ncbi:MAG: serine hydroxymethyltransferase, partial [Gammaproteobacteria bacterium]|nr:serine hydroxymethyltransferase [Gammaproteobacteria bacterium]
GGHLTHGAKPNQSGKWFNAVQYGVVEQTGLIDYDEVETLAREHQPRLIIAGGSAYPRIIDFARMRAICDAVGALLMVDMAHFAGLVAGRAHPNPLEHAHVVTTTTHKTLRGPRGGMILSNDPELGKKINSAIFPGLQGGPLEHVIAAKAVAFREAMQPEFRHYSERVVANARALGEALVTNRIKLVTDGTDTHLLNVDLRPLDVTGKVAEQALESVGLTCNKNAVPYDPKPPAVTSGVRLGSPAGTTRGFDEADFRKVGELIAKTLSNLGADGLPVPEVAEAVRADVRRLCEAHPIY